MNVFAFDIETIPDINAGRRLLNISPALGDADVARAMFHRRTQETGTEFQSHYLHQIIAVSVAFRSRETFHVWSLGTPESTEKELIERFFSGVEKYSPTLVTWNGSGFDLPVLHYRGLLHGVRAERYWENGDDDTPFRWNNYLNRYHYRHTDLMEILAGFQMRARAPLNEIALLLGFPGKMDMDGADVYIALVLSPSTHFLQDPHQCAEYRGNQSSNIRGRARTGFAPSFNPHSCSKFRDVIQ